jgi:HD-GYP domain-containing protein (c-di-GMP phosphodiesterase class II)/pSer/pThr/pTyr-binding forkhead associated (FHA) protein
MLIEGARVAPRDSRSQVLCAMIPAMSFAFVIRSGAEAGRTVTVAPGQTVTVGRLTSCEVPIEDEAASRRHCALHGRDDRCVVADLQSANGTFVNDQRVSTADVRPGDRVRVGSTVFECLSRDVEAHAGNRNSTRLALLPDDEGRTVVRRALDPTRPEFLTAIVSRQDALDAAQRYLATIHLVSERLALVSTLDGLYEVVLSAVLEASGGDRAAILLRDADPAKAGLTVSAVRARDAESGTSGLTLSRTVINDVLDRGLSAFSHDAPADARYGGSERVVRHRIRSVMCAPMRTTERVLGVLYVDSQSAHEFTEAELELLAAIGNQAGVAVQRARLMDEMEGLFLDVMKAIAATIDAKDGYTHRHSERVAAFGVRLARELGFDAETRTVVELSGLLHDVGKIGVPDAILNKPGSLTDDEFREIQRHPLHGVHILGHIQSQRITALLPGVRSHHERWDGTGYPEGLAGEGIPLLGRVLGVADFIDALSSDRTYRRGLPLDDVVQMLEGQSGSAFDPAVVAAALALHARGELALPGASLVD